MYSKIMNYLVRMPILISSIILSTSVSAAGGDIKNPSGIIGMKIARAASQRGVEGQCAGAPTL